MTISRENSKNKIGQIDSTDQVENYILEPMVSYFLQFFVRIYYFTKICEREMSNIWETNIVQKNSQHCPEE